MNRRLAHGFDSEHENVPRPPVRAVVGLGSNLGDRVATLDAALAELQRLPLVDDVRASAPVESVAVTPDGPDAERPAYLNAVVLVQTRLAPSVLLAFLQVIETRHGRERRERWGDRTLDLDLIAYGDVVSRDAHLTLPHPRAAERDFVLVPWLSLDPYAEIPGAGRVEDLLAQLRSTA